MRSRHSGVSARRRRRRWKGSSKCGRTDCAAWEADCEAPSFAVTMSITMDHFSYRDRTLHCDDVPVPTLAEQYGTPLYVYSQKTLLHHLNQLQTAFASLNPLICYSIKSNPNLTLCKLMA